jgi:hypothetical protein
MIARNSKKVDSLLLFDTQVKEQDSVINTVDIKCSKMLNVIP